LDAERAASAAFPAFEHVLAPELQAASTGPPVDVELPRVMAHLDVPEAPQDSNVDTEMIFAPKCDVLLRATAGVPNDPSGLRPTQCQVDAFQRELRLLALGPIGPPRIVPFDAIRGVEQLTGEAGINIYWLPTHGEMREDAAVSSDQNNRTDFKVKLVPSDEQASSMLVAALTVFDRAKPGSSLATPATPGTGTPRSPNNSQVGAEQ